MRLVNNEIEGLGLALCRVGNRLPDRIGMRVAGGGQQFITPELLGVEKVDMTAFQILRIECRVNRYKVAHRDLIRLTLDFHTALLVQSRRVRQPNND